MIQVMLYIAMALYGVSIIITLYRILFGPTLPDRVYGLDMIGINIISVIAVISVIMNTRSYLDVILILAILAFIGTIAFSKFIERSIIIDRKRSD